MSLLFNAEALESWKEVDPDGYRNLIIEILDLFFKLTPNNVLDLKTADLNNDWENIRRLAHLLKSSCANVGAEEGHILLQSIERFCDEKKHLEAKATLKKFYGVYDKTFAQIASYHRQNRAA